MKKELTEKQKERFHRTLISCLPKLTKEEVLFYSKKKKVLKLQLTILSTLPSEPKRIAQTIAWMADQEVRDINNVVDTLAKK